MAGKHTPAPWAVVPYGDGDSLAVHDARGDWRVCFMATPSKDGDFEGIEANARLIAAAPELLEALEAQAAAEKAMDDADEHEQRAVAEGWRNDPSGSGWVAESYGIANKAFERARELRAAAIAKAKGEDGEASK